VVCGADISSRSLSETEAVARLKAEGPNTLPRPNGRTYGRITLEILREPMFALLLAAAAIYLVLGDLTEAIVLAVFASTSVFIDVIQEVRTERVLESLQDLTSPRALVIRDGAEKRIAGTTPSRQPARGRLCQRSRGRRAPRRNDLHSDESLLTGEAAPVRKIVAQAVALPGRPGGGYLPYVYSGNLVVRGHGRAKITATGARSEIGKIGVAITQIETEPPRLRIQTRRLVRNFAIVSLSLNVLALCLRLQRYGSRPATVR